MFSKIYQLLKILDKKDKINLVVLFFMTIVAMCLEVFSIVAILPLIQEFLSSENKFTFLSNIKYFEQYELINILILIFVLIHLFKFFYLFLFHYLQHSYVNNLSAKLTSRLFTNYLYKSYEFHTQKKTSIMIRNLITETKLLCSTFINPIFVLIIEIVILSGIIIFLFLYQSKLSLIIGLVFIVFITIYLFLFKKKFLNWGKSRQSLNNLSLKISLDGLTGIKDIMIYYKENYFRRIFDKNEKEFAIVAKLYSTFQQLPRLVFEFIIILFLIFLVIYLKANDAPNNNIIEIIGVYAAASIRFIPSTSRIIGSFQQLRFGIAALNAIINENMLKKEYYDNISKERKTEAIVQFKDSIELKDVSFHYENKRDNLIFKKLNLKIEKNQIIGIFGPSGSGKSTFVDLLCGLLLPTSGSIILDGKNIKKQINLRGLFAYVPQSVFLLNDTIKNNIVFGNEKSDVDKIKLDNSIKLSQLSEYIKELSEGIETLAGERGSMLSGGQIQRIGIARAIYNQSEILIFDESTNALDEVSESKILEQIKNLKKIKTIIMISHKISNLKICDKIYEIQDQNLRLKTIDKN